MGKKKQSVFTDKFTDNFRLKHKFDSPSVHVVGSSYLRYVALVVGRKRLVLKGLKIKSGKVLARRIEFPPHYHVNQLGLSGMEVARPPLQQLNQLLEEFKCSDYRGEMTIPRVMEHLLQKEHYRHPHLVVVVGGLNDMITFTKQHPNGFPPAVDGTNPCKRYLLCQMLDGLVKLRKSYGHPAPDILWAGFGRSNKQNEMARKIQNNMEKYIYSKSGSQNWPEWLLYKPLVASVMLHDRSSFDNLHWTPEAAEEFGMKLVSAVGSLFN